MKTKLLFLLLTLTQIVSAQIFTEIVSPFAGVRASSIAFSDVNGDGHEDVIITGQLMDDYGELIAKLYTNDGMGNFTEMMDTPFDGVSHGSLTFSDVNGDGSKDVLITGLNNLTDITTKLYTNDGMGNFTEKIDIPFNNVWLSSAAFSDVNGDGHEDVLIVGADYFLEVIAKLYINDGLGNFTEIVGTPFEGFFYGSIAFSDINSDGHKDVLMAGQTSVNQDNPITKLYINDGIGNFTEWMDNPFDDVWLCSIAFSDVNGNGHEDVLMTGQKASGEVITKLYTNDGVGNFIEKTDTPFEGVDRSSIAFSDVNSDGYEDVLITGLIDEDSFERIAKLYINDGVGNFTEMPNTPFDGVWAGSIAFSDVNGDGREDVLITGRNDPNEPIAKLYINNGITSSDDLEIGISTKFNVFPNPSISSTLYLNYGTTEMGVATIRVYEMNGTIVIQHSEFVPEGENVSIVDIASLKTGSYLIELHFGEQREIAKFLVE